MQISILKAGMLTTVQDTGRELYLAQAVPHSGVMDALSARIANIAIGNPQSCASLEFTYAAAAFQADSDVLLAYAGDGAVLVCENQKLPVNCPIFIPKGSLLKLINNADGARTYLSIAGGWEVPEVLGSRSTYLTAGFGGYHGRILQSGDVLKAGPAGVLSRSIFDSLKGSCVNFASWRIPKELIQPQQRKIIRIVPSREFNWFDAASILHFLTASFTVGLRSNRMGYHLEGPPLHRLKKEELLSTAVTPGTIQVTGAGGLILLMADCQTTGGYPRIGQVATVDLSLCAQLKPGDAIQFEEISREEAEILYIEQENYIQKITTAVYSRF